MYCFHESDPASRPHPVDLFPPKAPPKHLINKNSKIKIQKFENKNLKIQTQKFEKFKNKNLEYKEHFQFLGSINFLNFYYTIKLYYIKLYWIIFIITTLRVILLLSIFPIKRDIVKVL